jgi:hypothetical protein
MKESEFNNRILMQNTALYITTDPAVLRVCPFIFLFYSSQSQNHIMTGGQQVSQSVCQSWCQPPSGTHDHIFVSV